MRKLAIITQAGNFLVPEKHDGFVNDLSIIMDKWRDNCIDIDDQNFLEFCPEEPKNQIAGTISHSITFPIRLVLYIVDLEVASVDLATKPGIQIVQSMPNVKS